MGTAGRLKSDPASTDPEFLMETDPMPDYENIRTDKGFKINAGEGRIHGHITLKGVNSNILDLKVSGSDTDGGMAIFEQSSLSQGRGTPLHIHNSQDEVFYVIKSCYYFQAGDEKLKLTK